ncbi:MAG: hypothetical protein AB7H66_07755 [Hyphomonadaceae bacterium]
MTLQFRSRMCRRNTTTVELLEREPHDWVSKPEWNLGRLGGADHMRNGQSLPVPSWMGALSWDNVTVAPLLRPDGTLNPAAATGEILGAVIISFDNNNTPPHVIRNQMARLVEITRTILREEVESCRLAGTFIGGGTSADISNRVMGRMQQLAAQMWDTWDIIDLVGQLTIGSTFNPDQPTGINFVLMPAISGIPEERPPAQAFTGLPGGAVSVSTWVTTPSTRRDALTFDGSGALYVTPLRIQLTPTPAAEATASSLFVRIRTGGDDLRGGNDNVFASIQVGDRWLPEVMLNRSAGRWADNTTNDATLTLPRGTTVASIRNIRLRTTFGGGIGGDNWNMDSIRVEWRGAGGAGGLLAERSGGPFKRFTGDDRELILPLR